jgi:hypothetical protein
MRQSEAEEKNKRGNTPADSFRVPLVFNRDEGRLTERVLYQADLIFKRPVACMVKDDTYD